MTDKYGREHEPKGNSNGGQFVSTDKKTTTNSDSLDYVKKKYETPEIKIYKYTDKVCKINLNSEIQKEFDKATPKERANLAKQYILDNLRGNYKTQDFIDINISRKTAKEITHTMNELKLRVAPELGNLINVGKLVDVKPATHGSFKDFLYYSVDFKIKDKKYNAILNIGVDKNNICILYDVNQFEEK